MRTVAGMRQNVTTLLVLSPGFVVALNDVAVTETTPLTKGWFADFLDVPQGNLMRRNVTRLRKEAV